jgi:hypothetical protein
MSKDLPPERPNAALDLLERITAVVLVLVIVSLVWMIAATYWPELVRFASTEQEVGVISGLLITALLLVSVVALLRARPRKE